MTNAAAKVFEAVASIFVFIVVGGIEDWGGDFGRKLAGGM